MASVTIEQAFPFADGSAGHVCALGSAPNAGEWDILTINSNTVVSSVVSSAGASWSLLESAVANQGAYIYGRKATGGEPPDVTVTTSGNHPTVVGHLRVTGLDANDAPPTSNSQANASVGGSTPAHNTGSLSASGEFVVAVGALHSIQTANQTAPSWSSGYTGRIASVQGSSTTGVRQYVATKDGAGTAAETPSVSWSGDGCFNRYMLTAVFSAATAVDGTISATGPAPAAALTAVPDWPGVLAGVGPSATSNLSGAASGIPEVTGQLAGTAPSPEATFAASGTRPGGSGLYHPHSEIVAVAWLKQVTGLSVVATDLPTDNSSWAASGFITVQSFPGRTDPEVPRRLPVLAVDCWATSPSSSKPPWNKAAQLAEIVHATLLDHGMVPQLIDSLGARYLRAKVLSVWPLDEPMKIRNDPADYARYTFNMQMNWVEVPEDAV